MMRFVWGAGSRPLLGWFAVINLAIGFAIVGALIILAHRLGSPLLLDGMVIAAAFAVIAIGPLLAARLNRLIAIRTIAFGVVALSIAGLKLRSDSSALYSYRRLARAVTPMLRSGCTLVSYRHFVQSLPFYTGHREAIVGYRGELAPFSNEADAFASFIPDFAGLDRLWKSPACVVAIVNFRDLAEVSVRLGTVFFVGCEGKKAALSNRPAAGTAPRFDCESPARASAAADEGGLGLR